MCSEFMVMVLDVGFGLKVEIWALMFGVWGLGDKVTDVTCHPGAALQSYRAAAYRGTSLIRNSHPPPGPP